jgi:hypothetical protein
MTMCRAGTFIPGLLAIGLVTIKSTPAHSADPRTCTAKPRAMSQPSATEIPTRFNFAMTCLPPTWPHAIIKSSERDLEIALFPIITNGSDVTNYVSEIPF